MTTNQTQSFPVFVLEDAVLLPGGIARLDVEGRLNLKEGARVLVALSSEEADLGVRPVASVGTVHGFVEGGVILGITGRARIDALDEGEPLPTAQAEELKPVDATGTELAALALEARRLAGEIFALLPDLPPQLLQQLERVKDEGALADLLAHAVPAEPEEKQEVLEALDPVERLRLVVRLLARRREVLRVAHEIETQVQKQVSKAERDHVLRRKLQAIRKELGEDGDGPEDDKLVTELKAKELPAEVRALVDKELSRLAKLPEASPERSVSRGWLQWIADLPWNTVSTDDLDVERARAVLDADHRGLAKVKKRVLQFLAVRKLRGDLRGPILCLSGPPGVGKTSLGQSIARAMGRKFVRVSLGGLRDEAEIRGHRRTYVGALPGRIAQALKRAGTSNPVVMLDEIDKVSMSSLGDPSAALLEVLDPEQNNSFVDHYLEVPLDLSRVLFIATANDLSNIPGPLRDRMEILELPSYTLAEKAEIARTHLWPKQLEAHGLAKDAALLDDAALSKVIAGHTREAGVRGLEKRLAELCRSLAVEAARGAVERSRIGAAEVETLLGPDRFDVEPRDTDAAPGVAAGLAWTPVGGEVLYVESLRMPGTGRLILSGQLGEVMQESARAALSYAKANARELGLGDGPVLEGSDLHVHVPAGGVPKDGPSAGVTLFTAIVSLLTGRKVRADVAMTGEVSLRGRVLPVGGIKEKVLAAHRLGMKRVILPKACAKDLRDIPDDVRSALDVVLVERMEEVLQAALVQDEPRLRVAA